MKIKVWGLLLFSLLAFSCSTPKPSSQSVKNIILIIGDGMGPQQVALAVLYAKHAPHSVVKGRKLNLQRLIDAGETGLMMVEPKGNLVTDSAASATQMATGMASRVEAVGLDYEGNPVPTILEKARNARKATGIISNTRLTHATLAAFGAHQLHRSMENEIAVDLLNLQPDVMLSGGIRHWLPKTIDADLKKEIPVHIKVKSKRKDERNLLKEARSLGYEVVFSKQRLRKSSAKKLLGLFSYSIMPDAIEILQHRRDRDYPIPTLKEMTEKALEILSKNERGFFLLIEEGLIDYAGHYNDAGMMLHAMLQLDEVVGYVYDWARKRDDTLVVVTADHETGSFGFSYSKHNIPAGKQVQDKRFRVDYNFGSYDVLDKLYAQTKNFGAILRDYDGLPKSQQTPAELQKLVTVGTGFPITLDDAKYILTTEPNAFFIKDHSYLSQKREPKVDDFKRFYVYGNENRTALIARVLAGQQQVVWGTGTHTSTPVPVFAYGPKGTTKPFDGLMHSSDLGQKLQQAFGF